MQLFVKLQLFSHHCLTVELLDVFVQSMVGFEDVEAEVANELVGSVWYWRRGGKGIQKVIEVA
jgi:hypothetical protein